jgi:hypothetical protein
MSWQLPVLSRDIRKIPSATKARSNRKRTASPMNRHFSTKETSTDTDDVGTSSTAVGTGADSSATSLPTTPLESRDFPPRATRKVRYALDHAGAGQPKTPGPLPRYWSEYDHPEDGSDDENGYFIYVNPNEDTNWMPFHGTANKLYSKMASWFSPSKTSERKGLESDPLLQPTQNLANKSNLLDGSFDDDDSTTSSSSSSDDEDDLSLALMRSRRNYGTLGTSGAIHDPTIAPVEDTITMLLTSSLSLFFAVTLSFVLLVLSATARHKARGEIDVVVIFGVIISLLFGATGFWGLVRSHSQTLARWAVGGLVFASVVTVDGILVGWVFVQLKKMDVPVGGVPTLRG